MSGQIDDQRRHCRESLLYRMEIGALTSILAISRRSNPVDWSAIGVQIFHDILSFVSNSQSRGFNASKTCQRHIWDIHIENNIRC